MTHAQSCIPTIISQYKIVPFPSKFPYASFVVNQILHFLSLLTSGLIFFLTVLLFFFFFKNGTYIGNKQQFAKSYLTLFVTPWTVARQAPLSMRFPRQEYRSGLAFLPSGYLSNPEIKPMSPTFTDRIFTT